ncbi:hypothetical protein [Prochlorococcus marinus]|uniref:hypothetical protein n=1 Tax=Prochlorococcus marinus TaxID=1219 RepID=UPI00164F6ADB|nr:hypothetical protein [Prochlorococcus marinus]MBW3042054.1 hypothetical protein [Prochlorococcus marinus str. XMU1408]
MNKIEDLKEEEKRDAIDTYFECVTACSLDEETIECTTKCVEVHLKGEDVKVI